MAFLSFYLLNNIEYPFFYERVTDRRTDLKEFDFFGTRIMFIGSEFGRMKMRIQRLTLCLCGKRRWSEGQGASWKGRGPQRGEEREKEEEEDER